MQPDNNAISKPVRSAVKEHPIQNHIIKLAVRLILRVYQYV